MCRSTSTHPGSSARLGEELARRRVRPRQESACAQEPRHRSEEGLVVIDDMHCRFGHLPFSPEQMASRRRRRTLLVLFRASEVEPWMISGARSAARDDRAHRFGRLTAPSTRASPTCTKGQSRVAHDDVKMRFPQANYAPWARIAESSPASSGELATEAEADPEMTARAALLVAAWRAALMVGAAAPAHAIQFGLKDGPGAKFNDDDFALDDGARRCTALKSPTEGEVLEWKSDKTPASGSVVPMNKLDLERPAVPPPADHQRLRRAKGARRLQVLREAGRQVEAGRAGQGVIAGRPRMARAFASPLSSPPSSRSPQRSPAARACRRCTSRSPARRSPTPARPAGRARGRQPGAGRPGESGFRLLPTGDFAFDARLTLARRAERSLDVQYYQLAERQHRPAVPARAARCGRARRARAPARRRPLHRRRGRAVPQLRRVPERRGAPVQPAPLRAAAASPQRIVASLHEFSRINHRMHNKLFIADNRFAVVRRPQHRRRVLHAQQRRPTSSTWTCIAAGPIVRELSQVFDRYWNSALVYPVQDGRRRPSPPSGRRRRRPPSASTSW